jgi:hypothetical protein
MLSPINTHFCASNPVRVIKFLLSFGVMNQTKVAHALKVNAANSILGSDQYETQISSFTDF